MATATNWLGVDGAILTQELDYRFSKSVGKFILTNRQEYPVYVQVVTWHPVNPNTYLNKSSDFKTHFDNGQWVKHEGLDMWEETRYIAFPGAIDARPWVWIDNHFSAETPTYWEIRSERVEPTPPRPYPSPAMYEGEQPLRAPWLGKLITESLEGSTEAPVEMIALFPSSGSRYDIYTYIDGAKVRLYHQLLNFGGDLYPWLVEASSSGDYYLSQDTPNGSGFLTHNNQEVSWRSDKDPIRWVNFVRRGSGFVIELEPGIDRFIGRPSDVSGDGSFYGGATKSVGSKIVSTQAEAIIWNFVLVP